MGRTDSDAPGYAPVDSEDEFDPLTDDFVSKEKKYLHFDRALTEEARGKVRAGDAAIIAHQFWPLLGFTKTERRAKRDANGNLSFEPKEREIKFGSHADAALLEAYARRLARPYEQALRLNSIGGSVLAYRSNVGDNISQAKSVFDEISRLGNCVAVGVDIRKFFDKISHEVLLDNLKLVLNCERLGDPDYKIFRRMTRFEWVDSEQLNEALAGVSRPVGRLCDARQFRSIRAKRRLVQVNRNSFGIPQGTPLSGLYANISLITVDCVLAEFASVMGGIYRRYSDDIVIVAPGDVNSDGIIARIESVLKDCGLSIAENKTLISRFSASCGMQSSDKAFQYLGFTFDGDRILIRESSMNRYYAKMSSGIKSKVRAARKGGIDRDVMFLRHLFKKYTHFGKYRNFPRYAYRAAHIMNSIAIRRQLRNHMKIFKKTLEYYLNRAY